jgi:hypothetical protein
MNAGAVPKTGLLLFAAIALALPVVSIPSAGEKAAPRADSDDDFLFDEGLVGAAGAKAERVPANPGASEGLESREGWRLAEWEDRGELAKLPDPNKPGNTILRLATEGGKMGKSGAVIGNVMLPAETGCVTVSAYNPGGGQVKIALGLFLFGEVYYETAPQALAPGGWQVLKFDLAAADFKCAASKWQHTTALPKRVPVRSTVLLLFGGDKKAAVFYDGVSLDCLKLPELRVGAPLQFGREPAKGAYAGYVASVSANELRAASDTPPTPAEREMTFRARRGGSAPEAYYQEFLDRSVFRQLMPGDVVQVGWCDVAGARCVSWINLVHRFPRTGRLSGKVRSVEPDRGGLELEMTAVPDGHPYMIGKVLEARMPLNSGGVPDPERAALLKRVRAGMGAEIEYEHSSEYGVLIRSLKLPGGEGPSPAPPPPSPPQKPAGKEAEPD